MYPGSCQVSLHWTMIPSYVPVFLVGPHFYLIHCLSQRMRDMRLREYGFRVRYVVSPVPLCQLLPYTSSLALPIERRKMSRFLYADECVYNIVWQSRTPKKERTSILVLPWRIDSPCLSPIVIMSTLPRWRHHAA